MGRHTYDGIAPVWPTRSGDPLSDHINSMTKYVISSTLTNPEWINTTVISGDPVAEIKRLKEAPGKDIVQYGFGQLSFTMLEQSSWTNCAGGCIRCFSAAPRPTSSSYRDSPTALFDLVDTKVLQNGVVILSYRYGQSD
jgi:hypothetical protein